MMTELVVANGLVYTTTPKNTPKNMLDALNAHTGALVWQRELLSRNGPDGGRYYLSVVNGFLYINDGPSIDAYNAATGTLIWRRFIAPDEGMVVNQGVVYAESVLGAPQGQSSLYALNAQTGRTRWHVVLPQYLSSASPAVADDVVYVGAIDGTLLAFNASNGSTRWTASLGANNAIITAPVVDNGSVFVEADSTGLFAFDAQTGQQRWFAPSDPYGGSPAVAYGLVYVVEGIGALQAYNETTGALVWQQPTQQNESLVNTMYSATVANGVVYASANSGGPIAFNARTGKHLYTFNNHPTHGTCYSAPVVAEGMIFFNMLYTYNETDALKLS